MTLRIVQLTDLHLPPDAAAPAWANLRRVLEHLGRHEATPDLLVLTGDLVARRRAASYARLREALGAYRGRLRVLPGNHDSRRMLLAEFGDLLERVGPAAAFELDCRGWRLLGLDSVRRPFVHGAFGRVQLAWFAARVREAGAPVLVFVHHPPIRVGTWWLDKDLPRDRRSLESAVRGSRVRAIVCGHVHQPHEGAFGGVPVLTSPSTAYQFAPRAWLPGKASWRPAYRVLELEPDGALRSRVVALA